MATAAQTAPVETPSQPPNRSPGSGLRDARIVWVTPSLSRGRFMQPLFAEFAKLFPNSVVFTGHWPGFIAGYEDSFSIQLLKGVRFRADRSLPSGNPRGFSIVPPGALWKMWRARPDLIFVRGFDLCTLYALVIKAVTRCGVVLFWGGTSPHVAYLHSPWRLRLRRLLAKFIDYSVSHTMEGAAYLREVNRIPADKVLQYPYQPAVRAVLESRVGSVEPPRRARRRPVFLYVGRLIREKGLYALLEACALLEARQAGEFSLLVVGEGPEAGGLKAAARAMAIDHRIEWIGGVDYERLGAYYNACDVFVFPTFEDIIGMVVPEAMVFGKAILCSSRAGAREMVRHGVNGFVFDPFNAAELTDYMTNFLGHSELTVAFGHRSANLIALYSAEKCAARMGETVDRVLTGRHRESGSKGHRQTGARGEAMRFRETNGGDRGQRTGSL